jgi:Zn-dependent M28 family amino/carboxypeptidase
MFHRVLAQARAEQEERVRRLLVGGTAVALAAAIMAPTPASAVTEVNTKQLRKAVTVNGILAHMRVLQRIANQNDGTRVSGTPGHVASVNYVVHRLKAAGYKVTKQPFTFPFFRELESPTLTQESPSQVDYAPLTFQYSGSGAVTGALVPAGNIIVPPTPEPSSPSGCSPADFAAAPAEDAVALIQRGTCTFEEKAANAQAAGYDAVIIFNEGQPGRTDAVTGTLTRPFTIPVIGVSFAEGSALYAAAQAGAVTVSVSTSTEIDPKRTTYNVIADYRGGDPHKVLVVGAHLDSVAAGPGINDNGSGSATILEIAEEAARLKIKPRQKLRFAFWGAEEYGLLGSAEYVDSLSNDALASLWANLNFDMLASPNYARFVYDGDGSDTDPAGPPGSAQIEQVFLDYFDSAGLQSEPTAFDGRSDYGPFIDVGIPAGGLDAGAEGLKTAEEAEIYGGTAGEPYDSCYHQACDTTSNVSTKALNELGDAAAHAVLTLAKTRSGFYEDGSRVGAASLATRKIAASRLTAEALANPSVVGLTK